MRLEILQTAFMRLGERDRASVMCSPPSSFPTLKIPKVFTLLKMGYEERKREKM